MNNTTIPTSIIVFFFTTSIIVIYKILLAYIISKPTQIRSNKDTTVLQMTAKVATIEPWSNDFSKLVLEKCWKAKYTAINNETKAPSFVPLTKSN